jgi:hypothetical protein
MLLGEGVRQAPFYDQLVAASVSVDIPSIEDATIRALYAYNNLVAWGSNPCNGRHFDAGC